MQTDRACGTTRLAGVRHVWGPGDRPRVCRLCGGAQPRIITARLMVSHPVHVSCFDPYIVYTNMSGVTRKAIAGRAPSVGAERLVLGFRRPKPSYT